MRNLGHGQSVMFVAPPEIDLQIRTAAAQQHGPARQVDTLDVLRWAMLETCKDLQHNVSHWARQGIEYQQRAEAQQRYDAKKDVSTLKSGWMTREARSLQEMYGVKPPAGTGKNSGFTQQAFNDPNLQERLLILGIQELDDTNMDEEQEREVNHETEREQTVQRPSKGEPETHRLHYDVRKFIRTGTVPPRSTGVVSLFRPLESFGGQSRETWSSNLYASTEFLRTLENTWSGALSDYMRPVNWVVQALNGVLVVLSPYEVNELLPLIRKSSVVQLHIYAPRVTHSMRSFSRLDFYSIPPRSMFPPSSVPLPIQLQFDLFAGQLYLSSHQEYVTLCAFLGLYTPVTDQDKQINIQVESDGFVQRDHRLKIEQFHPDYAMCKLTTSPIPMLKEVIARRRKGMSYLRTHLGHILHARSLGESDFECGMFNLILRVQNLANVSNRSSESCKVMIRYSCICVNVSRGCRKVTEWINTCVNIIVKSSRVLS